jgi:hypothetical protein
LNRTPTVSRSLLFALFALLFSCYIVLSCSLALFLSLSVSPSPVHSRSRPTLLSPFLLRSLSTLSCSFSVALHLDCSHPLTPPFTALPLMQTPISLSVYIYIYISLSLSLSLSPSPSPSPSPFPLPPHPRLPPLS